MYSDYLLIRLFSNPPKIAWGPMGADYRGLTVFSLWGYRLVSQQKNFQENLEIPTLSTPWLNLG